MKLIFKVERERKEKNKTSFTLGSHVPIAIVISESFYSLVNISFLIGEVNDEKLLNRRFSLHYSFLHVLDMSRYHPSSNPVIDFLILTRCPYSNFLESWSMIPWWRNNFRSDSEWSSNSELIPVFATTNYFDRVVIFLSFCTKLCPV